MPIFQSSAPPSRLQRTFSAVASASVLIGACVTGFYLAQICAHVKPPSIGQFRFLTTFLSAIGLAMFGFLLCAYWRTRLLGVALIVSAGLLAATFQVRMAWLTKQNRVAWRAPDGSVSANRTFALVVYFRKGATAQQIDDFTATVLEQAGQPMHPEPEYPWFVTDHVRLSPEQANGFEGAAIDFRETAPASVTEAYAARVRSDVRVEKVFVHVAPDAIQMDAATR